MSLAIGTAFHLRAGAHPAVHSADRLSPAKGSEHGDRDPLPHPPGELVGVLLQAAVGAAGHMAASASRIVAVTASGADTEMACDPPGTSRVAFDPARSAMKRCRATGMLRSWSPNTNQ